MRVRLKWIPEEDQQLNLALRDLGADLLVASQWPALQLVDGKSDLFLEQLASRAGGKQLMLRQDVPIEACPLQEILLLIIMRHEGDAFLLSHPLPPFHRLAWHSCLMLMGPGCRLPLPWPREPPLPPRQETEARNGGKGRRAPLPCKRKARRPHLGLAGNDVLAVPAWHQNRAAHSALALHNSSRRSPNARAQYCMRWLTGARALLLRVRKVQARAAPASPVLRPRRTGAGRSGSRGRRRQTRRRRPQRREGAGRLARARMPRCAVSASHGARHSAGSDRRGGVRPPRRAGGDRRAGRWPPAAPPLPSPPPPAPRLRLGCPAVRATARASPSPAWCRWSAPPRATPRAPR